MRDLVPITLTDLRRYVNDHHEHNEAPTSWKFGVGIAEDGVLVGVCAVGRASGRGIDQYLDVEGHPRLRRREGDAPERLLDALRRRLPRRGRARLPDGLHVHARGGGRGQRPRGRVRPRRRVAGAPVVEQPVATALRGEPVRGAEAADRRDLKARTVTPA